MFERFKRWMLNRITPYVEYIAFYLLFPGGVMYYLLNLFYLKAFDYVWRQPLKNRQRKEPVETSPNRQDSVAEYFQRAGEDSEVIGIRRVRMRSSCGNFLSKKDAIGFVKTSVLSYEKNASSSPEQRVNTELLLTGQPGMPRDNGQWSFLLRGSANDVPPDWTDRFYDEKDLPWQRTALPNHWQLQGYDIPMYTNTAYPIQFDPPRAVRSGSWVNTECDLGLGGTTGNNIQLHDKEPGENATGLFRCRFQLPKKWQSPHEGKIYLHFAGVDSCLFAWINGIFIGYSQDSCLPVEFDVTEVLNTSSHADEDHVLAVKVLRWCDGTYLEDQDKWWLSGIYREVFLSFRPVAHISDFEFQAIVNPTASGSAVMPDVSTLVPQDEQEIYNPSIATVRAIPDDLATEVGERYSSTAKISVSVLTEGMGEQPHAVRVELWDVASARRVKVNGGQSIDDGWERVDRLDFEQSPVLVMTSAVGLSTASELPLREIADDNTVPLFINNHMVRRPIEFGEKEAPSRCNPGRITLSGQVKHPKLWTAESPHLYAMIISLHRSIEDAEQDKNELHAVTHRVGLRNVSIGGTDNVLRVNGVPLTIAGVNRHEFNSTTGRAVSRATMVSDAIFLKKLNFNAVRCSHYPPHPFWLDVCDEIGLYVIDEANIETHGFQITGQPTGYLASHPQWESSMASRVVRMFERDKNHPSIIGWSLGNECGHGPTHNAMAAWLRARDPFRFSQYESGGSCTYATDIICPMYQRPAWCKEQVATDSKKRPVILCEYAHAMGNSGGCLSKYWQAFRDPKLPRFQGGFIWDFVDQGLDHPSGKGYAYGGDFGDYPHTAQFCCNGIALPDRKPLPDAYEAAHLQAPIEILLVTDDPSLGEIKDARRAVIADSDGPAAASDDISLMLLIVNRRMHTSLSDLDITITPKVHGGAVDSLVAFNSFRIDGGDVPPGSFSVAPLTSTLLKSLQDTSLNVADIQPLLFDHHFVQSWLDVSVKTKPGSVIWHPDSFEVLHATITNEGLDAFMNKHQSDIFQQDIGNRKDSSSPSDSIQLLHISSDSSNIPTEDMALLSTDKLSPLRYHEITELTNNEPDGIVVKWHNGASAVVGGRCGRLIKWHDQNGRSLLATPIDTCLYRAGTDNDKGGMVISYRERWLESGLDRLERNIVHVDPSNGRRTAITNSSTMSDGRIKVCAEWQLVSPADSTIPLIFSCTAHYIFDPQGTIDVSITVYPPLNMPPIARCGLRWFMQPDVTRVKWYGLGPHEAYDDRKASAYVDVFETPIDELHTPYTVPQDNGRRADPRWIKFLREDKKSGLVVMPLPEDRADDVWSTMLKDILNSTGGATAAWVKRAYKGCGLSNSTSNHTAPSVTTTMVRAAGISGWGFHASHYSMETLDKTTHNFMLEDAPEQKFVQVHVDSRTMGVGGYDSWSPNVDDEYLIKPTHVIDALPSLRNLSSKFSTLSVSSAAGSTAQVAADVVTSTVNEIIKNGGVLGMHTAVRLTPIS